MKVSTGRSRSPSSSSVPAKSGTKRPSVRKSRTGRSGVRKTRKKRRRTSANSGSEESTKATARRRRRRSPLRSGSPAMGSRRRRRRRSRKGTLEENPIVWTQEMIDRWNMVMQDAEGVGRLVSIIMSRKAKMETRQKRLARRREMARFRRIMITPANEKGIA